MELNHAEHPHFLLLFEILRVGLEDSKYELVMLLHNVATGHLAHPDALGLGIGRVLGSDVSLEVKDLTGNTDLHRASILASNVKNQNVLVAITVEEVDKTPNTTVTGRTPPVAHVTERIEILDIEKIEHSPSVGMMDIEYRIFVREGQHPMATTNDRVAPMLVIPLMGMMLSPPSLWLLCLRPLFSKDLPPGEVQRRPACLMSPTFYSFC